MDLLAIPRSVGDRSGSSSPLSSFSADIQTDPVVAADTAIAVQLERLRVAEALAARDNVVGRLEDAYTSVQQKAAMISRLQWELDILRRSSSPSVSNPAASPGADVQLCSVSGKHESVDVTPPGASAYLQPSSPHIPTKLGRSSTPAVTTGTDLLVPFAAFSLGGEAEKTIAARQAILAALPLPSGIPEDSLQPIVLPALYSLHEFLRNTTGSTRLKNYRILAQPTTYWCPEREEHGYLLTPIFKCSTNPRVMTAHRWASVDVIGHMKEPTECFYNKDGKWYYAGTYRAFRMDDLTTQEWELLSTETTQALIKETLAARKNISPQNHYETSQLYAVGALRVACIGLQCVGFNDVVYRGILEQSKYVQWSRSAGWPVPTAALTTARQDTPIDDTRPAAN
ncbi:hypothetical protein J3A83DRAFT_4190594 [Scleroderma citrinum]